ncbi:MAG: sugar ABC transporter permease [Acholeplasmataceae bacterium]|nr:sugar ABC transporter permease [Acholeplasmataceae bacterium]
MMQKQQTRFRVKLASARWQLRNFFQTIGEGIRKGLTKIGLGFLFKLPPFIRALIYLSPALIVLGVFTFYPIFNSVFISFLKNYNIYTGEITGYTLFDNYLHILQHQDFYQAVINTAIIAFISVPITILVSLAISVALASIKSLKGFFQTIYFLPYVTNSIALGLVFAYMFSGNIHTMHTQVSLANAVLKWLGFSPIPWLGIGTVYWYAMSVVLLYTIWNGLAFKIIVFLTGIQSIDKQYYQAAQIDGASKYKTFRRVTVPLISPMIFYILITSLIGAFKTYTSVVAIVNKTGRITSGSTGVIDMRTIVFYVYSFLDNPGNPGNMSLAAAASIILFFIILIFTVIQLQVGKRRVHY